MHANFLYLMLFSVIGAALMFSLTWLKQKKDFNPKDHLPQYVVALIIGGLFAYFFDKKEVLAILMIFAQVAMVYMVNGLFKFGKVEEPVRAYGIAQLDKPKKMNWLGWLLIGLFVVGWFFFLTAEGLLENYQTLAYWMAGICLGGFIVICAGGVFGGWLNKK